MNTNESSMTTDQVLDYLSRNIEISDVSILETIDLRKISVKRYISKKIIFKDCIITELKALYLFYNELTVFKGCIFSNANFQASYFLSGCEFRECIFQNNLELMSMGGHNKPEKPIIITDCIFHGFVNFFDAWFEGPIEISRCHFIQGTNLLGNKRQPFEVTFDFTPVLSENIGKLDKDGQ